MTDRTNTTSRKRKGIQTVQDTSGKSPIDEERERLARPILWLGTKLWQPNADKETKLVCSLFGEVADRFLRLSGHTPLRQTGPGSTM